MNCFPRPCCWPCVWALSLSWQEAVRFLAHTPQHRAPPLPPAPPLTVNRRPPHSCRLPFCFLLARADVHVFLQEETVQSPKLKFSERESRRRIENKQRGLCVRGQLSFPASGERPECKSPSACRAHNCWKSNVAAGAAVQLARSDGVSKTPSLERGTPGLITDCPLSGPKSRLPGNKRLRPDTQPSFNLNAAR